MEERDKISLLCELQPSISESQAKYLLAQCNGSIEASLSKYKNLKNSTLIVHNQQQSHQQQQHQQQQKPTFHSNNQTSGITRPKETDYYDDLEISFTASPSDIKKAYFKLALKYHPDKSLGSQSEEKFKKVSEAYQVLSNPELKQRYDKFGKEITNKGTKILNALEFFIKMFGGEKFKEFIGDFTLLKIENCNITDEEREMNREERISKLASIMIHRLKPFIEDRVGYFEAFIIKTAEELKEEPFGVEILNTLGYIYEQKAQQYLGENRYFGLGGLYHGAKERLHLVNEAISTVSAAFQLQSVSIQMQAQESLDDSGDDKKAQLEHETALKGIQALWKLNQLDIGATIRSVCDLVLRDEELDKQTKQKRAEALLMLAKIFKAVH